MRIELSVKGTMVGVFLIVLGLTYLVFGARFARVFQPAAHQSKTPAYIAGVIIAFVGGIIYFALKAFLESKGYVFSFIPTR